MMRVVRYSSVSSLPVAYLELFEQTSFESIFLSMPWFKIFEETILSPNERVMVYGVEEGDFTGGPVAALVLKEGIFKNAGKLFRVAKIESLSNYYTPYFGLVMAKLLNNNEEEIINALAQALFDDRGNWDILDLKPLDPLSPFYLLFKRSLERLGLLTQTYFCFGNWYMKVAERKYAEYFESLPKVLRKNIPYETRRLSRNYRFRLDIQTSGIDLEPAINHYEKIYNNSWRDSESHPEFIRRWAKAAGDRGWLRLGFLYLNEEAVAAQMWFVHGRKAAIFKICYEENFSKFSIGNILTAYLIQHVIDEDEVDEIDYLSGDDSYKSNWMSHRRERWGLMVFNTHSLKGVAQAIKHIGGRKLNQVAKSIYANKTQNTEVKV
jgi:GNAT acetyltransferase-like protein